MEYIIRKKELKDCEDWINVNISSWNDNLKGIVSDKLLENYETIINAIIKAKPAAAKGQYIKSVAITTTMGPGIFINQK